MEHDDELAHYGGAADTALIAVTVAMHVAAIALLHRSARRLTSRTAAREAARIITARLALSGDGPLARKIETALSRLGTERFSATLRDSARTAAARLAVVRTAQLARLIGRTATTEVRALGARVCLAGGSLKAAEIDALAAHLADGAELCVGIGRGSTFSRRATPAHKLVEVELARVPDPRHAATLRARRVHYCGEAAHDTDVPASMLVRTFAGAAELRLVRDGRDVGGVLVLDGTIRRLTVVIRDAIIELAPAAQEPAIAAAQATRIGWSELHQNVQRDPLLAELVGDLYTRAGFGGTAEVLAALLALAPAIHAQPLVARRFVQMAPVIIGDPMTEIVEPLRHLLESNGADRRR